MSKQSFKDHLIMKTIAITALSLCGAAQAEEYKAAPALAVNATQEIAGINNTPSAAYQESATGNLKEINMPNNGKLTITSAANPPLEQIRTYIPSPDGQGAAK